MDILQGWHKLLQFAQQFVQGCLSTTLASVHCNRERMFEVNRVWTPKMEEISKLIVKNKDDTCDSYGIKATFISFSVFIWRAAELFDRLENRESGQASCYLKKSKQSIV